MFHAFQPTPTRVDFRQTAGYEIELVRSLDVSNFKSGALWFRVHDASGVPAGFSMTLSATPSGPTTTRAAPARRSPARLTRRTAPALNSSVKLRRCFLVCFPVSIRAIVSAFQNVSPKRIKPTRWRATRAVGEAKRFRGGGGAPARP